MFDMLRIQHPNFRGNWQDLEAFMKLATSRIRSPEREQALLEWEAYKAGRQSAAFIKRSGGRLRGAKFDASSMRVVDLSGATLDGICIGFANLRGVIFDGASMRGAKLKGAYMENCSLHGVDLSPYDTGPGGPNTLLVSANLSNVDFEDANLSGADLSKTMLTDANLKNAKLLETNLSEAILVRTILNEAELIGNSVYGIAAWDVQLDGATQKDLHISPSGQSPITVDNLKIAQFIYLLLNNAEIRDAIDTITSKAVLILGRFTPERKVVLDAIRDDLRSRGFLPILFDFEKPSSRDLTETVVTLAHLSRFVIADLTNPSSIPHELMSFVRDLPSVPVQPIILKEQRPYAMFLDHLGRYQHVLECYEYESQDTLLAEIAEKVIQPAQDKAESMKPKPF
jgi:uncharacterized protein YjbI with pentapeptide repeats